MLAKALLVPLQQRALHPAAPLPPRSFVFEGKPPELKRAELAKRSTKKEEATTELEAAKEVGSTRLACCCPGWRRPLHRQLGTAGGR